MRLRFITYLAPSLPIELFQLIAGYVGQALSVDTELLVETRFSGPPPGEPDPFSQGLADAGFMCAPSYLRLHDSVPPAGHLLGVALAPCDPRAAGRAVYFSDVVVRAGSAAGSFADLRGARWAYNDATSLSGYYSLQLRLAELALDAAFMGEMRCSGSHLASLRQVLTGEADAAAIDSNALRGQPDLARGVRILESWGPFPIQPIVVRCDLDAGLASDVRSALLNMPAAPLRDLGFDGFASVEDADYDAERKALAAL